MMLRVLFVCACLCALAQGARQETRTVTTVEGLTRSYLVYLPNNYQSNAAVPYSVIFYFHGYSGMCGGDGYFRGQLDSANNHYIAVQPCALKLQCTAGIPNEALGLDWQCKLNGQGETRWNAGELCCQRNYDDGAFVAQIVSDLQKNYRVDAAKMFVTGFSNGCMFTEYLMCNYANLFAGGSCSSGALMLKISSKADTYATCDAAFHPKPGVKFLKFHGDQDGLVAFNGSPHFTSAPEDAQHWASRMGCSATPITLRNDGQYNLQQFPNCRNGGDMRFCIAKGGGHNTPGIFESYILDYFFNGAVPVAPSTCAVANENDQAQLSCGDKVITGIKFASYGTPSGSCDSGFTATASCDAANTTLAAVRNACVGHSTCAVSAANSVFGDPCPGIGKKLAVSVECGTAPKPSATCGVATEGGSLTLQCAGSAVIKSVDFASYGTPTGSCNAAFATSSCHSTTSQNVVAQQCVGKNSCTVDASNSLFGDPCSGIQKQLAAKVTCA